MTSEPGGFVPVDTGLVLQTLVEAIFARVEELSDHQVPAAVAAVLDTPDQAVAGGNARELDLGLRRAGYLGRVVEAELFEPARRTADWAPDALRRQFASAGSWPEAIAETCGEIARTEPQGKPSPDDELAMSWRVPGPGGHVRHFLARRTIEEHLRELEGPVVGSPAELKRPWLYGFFVRVCEEALPEEATLGLEG
ncbi:MAG: hypothetical protein H0U32_00270 [Thermoleophilaceae bacterium]|nr:hypothetical protein [Thermoleophilaceae bacterium]